MIIFGLFKSIIIGITIFIVTLGIMFFSKFNLPKDDIINAYNSFIQIFDFAGLSKDSQLIGKRVFGTDKYIGTYEAEYENKTSEETIFGGTALNRKNGEKVKLKIKIEKESGNINVVAKLGKDEIKLIEDTGEYEDNIYIEGISYYLTIKLEEFTGKINIVAE